MALIDNIYSANNCWYYFKAVVIVQAVTAVHIIGHEVQLQLYSVPHAVSRSKSLACQ